MKRSRLSHYILISILLHLLLLWLLRWLPPYEPVPPEPVAIRVLDAPLPLASVPPPASQPPAAPPKPPAPPQPPKSQKGGVLAELPKPQQQARPDDARIVSQYDSRAQDIGPGERGVQKPSGQTPPQLPPELALPERYSQQQPAPPRPTPQPPASSTPAPPPQSRAQPPKSATPPKRQPSQSTGTLPIAPRQNAPAKQEPEPDERQFRISKEEEVAMLQREREALTEAQKKAVEEHFTRLERRDLPLPTFDAPGVYEQGPERPGEGNENTGGGKYRSIDAFGLKHFSYLIGVKRKIELVFSIPFFGPPQGRVGVPIVGFTIQRNGELSEAVLLRSSGYGIVDQALIEAVRRAAPYGPFPNHLPDQEISIRVYATIS
jgi:TonB family protein